MEEINLFFPELLAEIGPYRFTGGIKVEARATKAATWAKVAFTPEYQPKLAIPALTPGSLSMGYGGELVKVFEGYATAPYNQGTGAHEILLRDGFVLLEQARITNTFLDTTPQEILAYCLEQAGVTGYRLARQAYPVKKVVPVAAKPVAEVIKTIRTLWGIAPDAYFSGGQFYWGEQPAQEKLYHFEYGVNILSLERLAGHWELETVSMPFVKVGHTIRVTHPEVAGEFEALGIAIGTNDAGFIRTTITF